MPTFGGVLDPDRRGSGNRRFPVVPSPTPAPLPPGKPAPTPPAGADSGGGKWRGTPHGGGRWRQPQPSKPTKPSKPPKPGGKPVPTTPKPPPKPRPTTTPPKDDVPVATPPPAPTVPVPQTPAPGPTTGAESLTDPMMMFLSAVPGMRLNTQKQIGDAIAGAGFTGNRWGTSAMRTAGEIGAEGAMAENAMLQKILYDYANDQENRALQATNTALGAARLEDDLATSRVMLPFQIGAWEQGRQDDFARTLFEDWQANRLGWLGPFLEAAMSQGAGSAGSPGSIITVPDKPAEPGVADWLTLFGGLFG